MSRFKSGESGHAEGRRVARPIGIWLDRLLKDDEALHARDLAKTLLEAALGKKPLKKNQLSAMQELMDRVEGRPAQQIKHTGNVGTGLAVVLSSKALPADLAAQAEKVRAQREESEGGRGNAPTSTTNGHAQRNGSKF